MAAAGAGAAVFGYEFLSPNVLYEPSPITNAGKPDRYPQGSVTADPKTGIYLVHEHEGFYALSSIFSHLGCLTTWAPEQGLIACPFYARKFPTAGVKFSAPQQRQLS